MTSPFEDYEVEEKLRPLTKGAAFDLDAALASVVVPHAQIPEDAFTAKTLGVDRIGNGVVIGKDGLVLTIGYLITEAEDVTLITNDGRRISAHVLGYDQASGLGLVHALEPLELPALPLGDSRRLKAEDPIIIAGGGGLAHASVGRVLARASFAGYWEYLLKDALYTGPGHPHWSGAALIDSSGGLVGIGSLQMVQESETQEPSLINMCVPIDVLPPILDDLARGRTSQPPRPWLGLFSQDAAAGVVVLDVATGGPAARAEVRRGDVVLAVAGRRVENLEDFYAKLWALGPAGVTAPLQLRREGDVFDVEIRTIDRTTKLKKRLLN